jgi:hypothetical protein
MNAPEISWKLPWYPIQSQAEIHAVQHQLEMEITENHPLSGKDALVIGRRIDNDDVLVKLNGGKYARVHLVWGITPAQFSTEYPRTLMFESLDDFLYLMEEDVLVYGEDET